MTHDGRELGGTRGNAELLVGTGIMGGGNVNADHGRLDVDADLGASLGVGGHVGVGATIDAGHIAGAASLGPRRRWR